MGIRSTHAVTRADAIAIIVEKTSNINRLSDEQLGDLLDELINNRFYNFQVCENAEEHQLHITRHNYPSEQP